MDAWETALLAQREATSEALRAEEEKDEDTTPLLLRWWQAVQKLLAEGV